jgi:hypothetical protein
MVKTVLVVVFLAMLALIWFHRERVYLRDPIATVYRGGVEQSGIQVFINGSNDVLIEQDGGPSPYRVLVQQWNQSPGTPTILRCLHWMACLTDADRAAVIPLAGDADAPPTRPHTHRALAASAPQVTMTNRETSFTAPDGGRLRIVLR